MHNSTPIDSVPQFTSLGYGGAINYSGLGAVGIANFASNSAFEGKPSTPKKI